MPLADVPDLASFGTVLGFAAALEEACAGAARAAARTDLAERHAKRARQVGQWRRERLCEVVLQPLTGLDPRDYQPAPGLEGVAALADLEAGAARFYTDAAQRARACLGGLSRPFLRLAEESRTFAASLGA